MDFDNRQRLWWMERLLVIVWFVWGLCEVWLGQLSPLYPFRVCVCISVHYPYILIQTRIPKKKFVVLQSYGLALGLHWANGVYSMALPGAQENTFLLSFLSLWPSTVGTSGDGRRPTAVVYCTWGVANRRRFAPACGWPEALTLLVTIRFAYVPSVPSANTCNILVPTAKCQPLLSETSF